VTAEIGEADVEHQRPWPVVTIGAQEVPSGIESECFEADGSKQSAYA